MALFQQKVIKEYLQKLDDNNIKKSFEILKENFGLETQENISNSTEISMQGEFVQMLFVDVLGYTANPKPKFNIKREKNSSSSKERADAAIIKDNDETKIIGVIELKDKKTSDLQTIESQVFGYFQQHQPLCRYAITSNYQHIRLYVDDKYYNEQFDIYDLVQVEQDEKKGKEKYERFKELYLYLNKDFVLGVIQKIIPPFEMTV